MAEKWYASALLEDITFIFFIMASNLMPESEFLKSDYKQKLQREVHNQYLINI